MSEPSNIAVDTGPAGAAAYPEGLPNQGAASPTTPAEVRVGLTCETVAQFRKPAVICQEGGTARWAQLEPLSETGDVTVAGQLPGIFPEWLGHPGFAAALNCRFSYVAGEMARGIATADMVIASVKSGFAGFYGSAGLRPEEIARNVDRIIGETGPDAAWGANLIHSPDHLEREREVVDLFLEKKVRNVSASAFMSLSPEVVRYSAAGLSRGPDGRIVRDTNVFAKISRAEVAQAFLAPPPEAMLRELAASGAITAEQAGLQVGLPTAEFFTVESDSGGHTDNRPLGSLFPAISGARDAAVEKYGYERRIFLGAAGGIGTPVALASAYALGADYAVTGSVNQSAVESGLSEAGREMLCLADLADVAMAPASDMFELGVKVQVLKRGTMFASKGQKLLDLYRRYDALEALPEKDLAWLEKQVLRETAAETWQKTRDYLIKQNPALAQKAEADPKQKMALVFRRYLFMGAQWAREGDAGRRIDYQIWAGPAVGSFNSWVKGTFLESHQARTVKQIGLNLLEGAAQITRAHQLHALGIEVPRSLYSFTPRPLDIG